jgi:hypothetical protein
MKFDVLDPLTENEFFWANQIVVDLPKVFISSGVVKSNREIQRLSEQKAKIFLITKNSTFPKMQLSDIRGKFALWPGEEVMIGNNFLKRVTITPAHAIEWGTKGFVPEENSPCFID